MIPWYIKAGIALTLVAALAVGVSAWKRYVYYQGYQAANRDWIAKDLQAKLDTANADLATASAELLDLRARATEAAARQATLEKEKNDARKAADRLAADLRAGAIRVRSEFRCPAPQAGEAAASGELHEAHAGFGAEDAITALGIAREGDDAIRELNACVDQLAADRQETVQ